MEKFNNHQRSQPFQKVQDESWSIHESIPITIQSLSACDALWTNTWCCDKSYSHHHDIISTSNDGWHMDIVTQGVSQLHQDNQNSNQVIKLRIEPFARKSGPEPAQKRGRMFHFPRKTLSMMILICEWLCESLVLMKQAEARAWTTRYWFAFHPSWLMRTCWLSRTFDSKHHTAKQREEQHEWILEQAEERDCTLIPSFARQLKSTKESLKVWLKSIIRFNSQSSQQTSRHACNIMLMLVMSTNNDLPIDYNKNDELAQEHSTIHSSIKHANYRIVGGFNHCKSRSRRIMEALQESLAFAIEVVILPTQRRWQPYYINRARRNPYRCSLVMGDGQRFWKSIIQHYFQTSVGWRYIVLT